MIRMTVENNSKYIAEAWIDNGEEQSFKESYLNSLIEQYQGEGNGFDADTVDGKHWDDIESFVNDELSKYIVPFLIGKSPIGDNNDTLTYYLGFDGIKLYLDDNDSYSNEEKQLPWKETIEETAPTLFEVINELYRQLYLGDNNEFIPNKEIYDTFVSEITNRVSEMEIDVNETSQSLNGKITTQGEDENKQYFLNADTVNGIRFFIYSKTQYQNLKNLASQYVEGEDNDIEVENAHKKITSINNVFIIKEDADMEASCPDGVYSGNPDEAIIDKGYQFQIIEKEVYNEETDSYETIKVLQYSFLEGVHWHDIGPTSDFIDYGEVRKYLIEFLSSENYPLSQDAVAAAFNRISSDDISSSYFANYLNGKYLIGGGYKESPNDSEYLYLPTREKQDEGLFLDLTSLKNSLDEEVNDTKDDLQDEIDELIEDIEDLSTKINAIKGGNDTSISSLVSQLDSLKSRVTTLETKVNTVFKSVINTDYITLHVNSQLRIAHLVIHDLPCKHKKSNNGKRVWEDSGYTLPSGYRPKNGLVTGTLRPEISARLATDGKVFFMTTTTPSVDTTYGIYAYFTYPY